VILSCPECNGKVSSNALNCPHCGYAMQPVLPGELEGSAVPCPYCAETIQIQATICPYCRAAVSQGRAIHPAHRRQPAGSNIPDRSFTSLAVICALLYLLCWPVSLILNIMWLSEASSLQTQTGREPAGKGCLVATMVVGGVLAVLIVLGLMRR
jgi:hypothetical protein